MRPIKWLRPNESLPGGTTAIYNADCLIRMEQAQKLDVEKELCIHGFISRITICKSRNNMSGITFDAIFNSKVGIDNVLTNYRLLRDANRVGGSGTSFYLTALPSVKFPQKSVRDLYAKNREFKKVFDAEVAEVLNDFINDVAARDPADDLTAGSGGEEYSAGGDGITAEDIRALGKKDLRSVIAEYGVEVDIDSFATLADAKEAVIEAILGDQITEDEVRVMKRKEFAELVARYGLDISAAEMKADLAACKELAIEQLFAAA